MRGSTTTPVDTNVLCMAFTSTLSSDAKARKEAERLLGNVSLTPGLLVLLCQIITKADVDVSIRTAAAIFLKNEVRRHWDSPVLKENAAVYSQEEKQTFRDMLLPLLETVLTEGVPVAVIRTIDDCVRCVAHADYPEQWPSILTNVIERLKQRTNLNAIRAALLILRRLVKKYEYRPPQDKDSVGEMLKLAFPILLCLASDLSQDNCFSNEITSSMIKTILKIYWSSTQMVLASGEAVETSIDSWMQLIQHVIEAPVPEAIISATSDFESRANLQQYKAKKWAVQVVHRYLHRGSPIFSERVRNDKGEERCGNYFIEAWSCKFMEQFLQLLRMEKTGLWISERMKNIIIQYLSQCLELAVTYKKLKPHVEFIVFEVCFPLLCYTTEDIEKWELDPAEFIRSQGIVLSGGPRDCAVEFIQSLTRLRGRDFFESLSGFVQNVLIAHQSVSLEEQRTTYNRKKDGALFMIGAISDRLTSKKRQLQMEPFLVQYVLPELSNQNDPFLRLRACWTYRQFLDDQRNGIKEFKQPEKLIEAFVKISELCSDRELPIRVEAAVSLRTFFDIEEEKIRSVIELQIPQLMERLFSIMAAVQDNELIVSTLESLVINFEEQIPPYAVQLTSYLSSALLRMMDVVNSNGGENVSPTSNVTSTYGEEEDCALTAISVASAISSVLSTLTEPKFHHVYEQICPHLVELLDAMFSPAGIDFIDDGLVILTYLTFYSPNTSIPTDLWRYYELCYQAICGGNSNYLTLDSVCASGWAPDYLEKMLPVLDNLISRDPQRFLTGVSSIERKSYKQLFLEIIKKCISTLIDPDSPKNALELMMLLFEAYIGKAPAVDDMMAPCFQLLIEFIQVLREQPKDNPVVPRSTISLCVRLLSTMMVYNPTTLFNLCESQEATQEVLKILSDVEAVRTYEGKRVVVLAFAQLLDLSVQAKLPVAFHSHIIDIVRTMATQLKKSIDLKKKAEEEEFEDESNSDDSEQDIDENEDANSRVKKQLLATLSKAAEAEDEDNDEDYFDQEAVTDDFPVRDSPLDKIDELEIITSLINRMPSAFTSALGSTDVGILQQFLIAEAERRKANTVAETN